jgi:hypothetical protein
MTPVRPPQASLVPIAIRTSAASRRTALWACSSRFAIVVPLSASLALLFLRCGLSASSRR